ncbi:hypothetical protein TRFO_35393 [Tritrichomonas foetus]|uniref:Longin domain-containing protein n=1 Tax=Tritrichomonas foetus TaxID=1144522 RepID=A0A1J4JKZ8_9EUKA|nr:hypothetical protein TRFO_35393 [Tritrichomonas foetus]|eukprot:OHS98237.1 hypothetical protein TRFO_35393 [Tritrichomonas foetus]
MPCQNVSSMEFCYSAVFRKDIPLAQYCPKPGNFDLFFQQYTEKNNIPPGKTFILSDGYYWGLQIDESGLIILCVSKMPTDQDLMNRILDDIKLRFLRLHANEWKTAAPFSLQTRFEPQLIAVNNTVITLTQPNSIVIDNSIHQDEQFDSQLVQLKTISYSSKKKKSYKFSLVTILTLLSILLIYSILVAACNGFNLPKCF